MSAAAGPGLSNRAIYSAALDLTDAVLRQAYLDKVCGDDAERRVEIEQLLAAHTIEQTNPLDKVIEQLAREDLSPSEPSNGKQSSSSSPPVIDRYKIREQIGEGGMGVVYVAEQTSPVRRKVALKIIKPGMNRQDVIARLEAERQALALMDHPNIARVLDAATMDDGRPYFVMELVMGVPITEFCDDNKQTTRERLKLFIDVCSAVQHAHQKGIIHRDLKPSNIMVTMNDDRPMPKVIDFGIAKALSQPLTDHSIYTAYGQMVGTPVYMSPEQAQLNATDVDTRSDVYSLGVLLYELLTGSTPFDKETLQKSGFDEMRRVIREVDPPRPSQRISTLKADLSSTISGRRSADPRTLSRLLMGELDWIVMRALEKDRKRRYQSPRDLAEDIQRYMDGEAVDAFPPSIAYRLTKTMHKHRAALFSLSLLLLGLLAAIVGTSWQAVRATRAERQSENRLATLEIEQGKTRDALSKAESAEREQRRLRLDAEAYAHRERAAAELQRELKESSELAERDAKWNLYVARLFPIQTAFKDRDYGRLDTLLKESVPSESDPDYRGWEWYYLKERVDTNSMKLTLDHGKVHGPVAWNPVADQFATFCSPTFIDIWNGESLSHLRRIDCQVTPHDIEWSKSGTMIAVGSAGCELSVVDARDGAIVWRGRPVSVPNQDIAQNFSGLSWNPDGHRIAVANRVAEIAVVDIDADTTVTLHKPDASLGGHLAWHPDGNRLAAGLRYGERTVFDVRDFSRIQLERLNLEVGNAMAWSPSGALLATSEGSKIRIADQHGHTQSELTGHLGKVVCLEWSDDSTLVSSSQDHTIRVWSSADGQLLDTLKIIDAPVDHMALDAKGRRLVCGTTDGELRICQMFAAPRQHVSRLVTGDRNEATEAALDASSVKNSISELKWSPDGVRLAAAGEISHGATVGGSCGIWNSASLRPINAYQTGLCKGLDWSTDGTQLLRAAVGDQMRTDDFRTGRSVHAVPCPLFGDPVAFWSPSKRWVVSHGKHAPILRDGTSFQALFDWDKTVIAQGDEIAWSPSERYFVAGGWGVPVLCQLDGRSLRCPDLLSLTSFGIDWHPSGEVIAFGGRTGKIVLRDRHKLDSLAVLNGHTSEVTGIDFSPDGRRLASASLDGTVRIWDFSSGAELLQLTVEGVSAFSQVAWSPDGLQLAAGTTVRQVVVWGSHKVQPTPATATSIESGPVIKAIESQLGFPLDWNRNVPKLSWRDPLTTLEECAGGFEEPIDRDRFDGLIEKALSEGNPAKDDHDSLVRAWLVLIEAHRDANSAVFLVERLLRLMERYPSDAANAEQWLTHKLNAYLLAGQRSLELARFEQANEFLIRAADHAEQLTERYPTHPTHWKQRISCFLLHVKNSSEPYLLQLRSGDYDDQALSHQRELLRTLFAQWKAFTASLPDEAYSFTHAPGDADDALFSWTETVSLAELEAGVVPTFMDEWSRQFELPVQRGTQNSHTHYQLALCHLIAGKTEDYRSVCRDMITRFSPSSDAAALHFAGWSAALAADSVDNYEPAIELARRAVEKEPDNQQYLTGLGAILMRAGRYAEAKLELERALAAEDSGVTSSIYVHYFLALAEQNLGNSEPARTQMQAANKLADEELSGTPSWNRRLTVELLRREAQTAIGGFEN